MHFRTTRSARKQIRSKAVLKWKYVYNVYWKYESSNIDEVACIMDGIIKWEGLKLQGSLSLYLYLLLTLMIFLSWLCKPWASSTAWVSAWGGCCPDDDGLSMLMAVSRSSKLIWNNKQRNEVLAYLSKEIHQSGRITKRESSFVINTSLVLYCETVDESLTI